MSYSQAQNKATQRYVSKAYDTISFRVRKGERAAIADRAHAAGYTSVQSYIIALINADSGEQLLTPRRSAPTDTHTHA